MNQFKKLFIINNEKIFKHKNNFYCDNIDIKSIPEELSKNFKVSVIARKSKIKRSHQIKFNEIEPASNIFSFLHNIFKTFKYKEATYLLISINPYTFFSYLLLFIFRKKTFVYLRSNGYEEYKKILGFLGPLIYHFMYVFVTFKSNIISCQARLTNKKVNMVHPSELDIRWLTEITKPLLHKVRLLYVGRVKIEKGIYSLVTIFNEIVDDIELSIVGKGDDLKTNNQRINFIGYVHNVSQLIKIYDNHNITILPSYTEAHPKVLDESLARTRPVIIFEEISHIIQNRYGVFVSKRNVKSLSETIKFIINNYSNIQENIKKNQLPTKKEFITQITQILN